MNSSRKVIKARDIAWSANGFEVAAPPIPPAPLPASVPFTSTPFVTPPSSAGGLERDEAQRNLLEAEARRQQALRAAQEEAAEIARQARVQAAEIAQRARLEGRAAAENETGQLLLTAKGVLDEVHAWRDEVFAQAESAVLNLVVEMARLVFGNGLALDRETLQAAFARALAEARPLGDLRVRAHPDDAALLGPHWPAQTSASLGQRLELVPDETIRRGGCMVEGQHGAVDARVETQAQLALDTLMAASPAPSLASETAVADGWTATAGPSEPPAGPFVPGVESLGPAGGAP